MPTLVSHVDPKFVILQTGSVLSCTFAPGTLPGVVKSPTILQKMQRLYSFWARKPPSCFRNYPDYVLPDPQEQSASQKEPITTDLPPNAQGALVTSQELHVTSVGSHKDSERSVEPIMQPQTPQKRIQPLHDWRREWFASLGPIEIPNNGTLVDSEGTCEPIQFSVGWSPDAIEEWAENLSQVPSETPSVEVLPAMTS
ncbi:hypothetical protein CVT24_013242 [Panaeolus cyanescens]|uniref:Uncharacterized protein n=1 Tax=Panaeolus cyanescens TaxID=181874 RepID=A0A409XBL8_9AGAR|nr:hypothetical protein CVT24_013242 [Panaeolus cyanescens]